MHELHSSITEQVKKLESQYPNDVVVVYDGDGRYRYVSANREAIMGYTAEETYGRHYRDFVAPDYMAHVRLTWIDTELTGQSIDSTVLLIKKSGEPARFRTIAWATSDPDTNAVYIIVKARLVAEGPGDDDEPPETTKK